MNMRKIIRILMAISISVLGILGSVQLKIYEVIGEPTLVVFVAFSLLAGTVIAFIERIESFSLKELNLKLREVKEAETSVKEVARAILAVIESQSHGLMLQTYDDAKAKKAIAKLEALIK